MIVSLRRFFFVESVLAQISYLWRGGSRTIVQFQQAVKAIIFGEPSNGLSAAPRNGLCSSLNSFLSPGSSSLLGLGSRLQVFVVSRPLDRSLKKASSVNNPGSWNLLLSLEPQLMMSAGTFVGVLRSWFLFSAGASVPPSQHLNIGSSSWLLQVLQRQPCNAFNKKITAGKTWLENPLLSRLWTQLWDASNRLLETNRISHLFSLQRCRSSWKPIILPFDGKENQGSGCHTKNPGFTVKRKRGFAKMESSTRLER